ncbi:hypothetical protein CHS0354_025386 [Potamilus streckersoni]|uniref:Uncharacterized protein n=1 Tax=Potamilus streckersoni TaxID=2493646 RepID=A0AAE0VZD1_9BIVA|nr:hypothetical protein CHS0354_025386 [Potamilus streckersoni]
MAMWKILPRMAVTVQSNHSITGVDTNSMNEVETRDHLLCKNQIAVGTLLLPLSYTPDGQDVHLPKEQKKIYIEANTTGLIDGLQTTSIFAVPHNGI